MDFSTILAAFTASPLIMSIVAAGALVASVLFASWITDVVASFFDDEDEPDPDDVTYYNADDLIVGELYECENCGYEMDYDTAVHSLSIGVCHKCGEELGED